MTKLAVLILTAVSVAAQQSNNPADAVRKVVDIKHLTGERAERAMKLVNAYMHPVGSVNFDPALKAAVLVGPDKVVAGAEALLAKFDAPNAIRPDRQIQLRVHLVEASPDEATGGPIPSEIAPAVDQMKKNFAYKGYRLLDTVTVIGKDGFSAMGSLPLQHPETTTYNLRVQTSTVLEDAKTIALKNFTFNMRVPQLLPTGATVNFYDTNVNTDLTLQQGQKLVVGKLASAKTQNSIFLIVTADVL